MVGKPFDHLRRTLNFARPCTFALAGSEVSKLPLPNIEGLASIRRRECDGRAEVVPVLEVDRVQGMTAVLTLLQSGKVQADHQS